MSARKQADIEQMTDCPKDKAYFENSIEESIRDFYFSEYGAESAEQIAKLGQNSFVAACEFARKQCITRADLIEYKAHAISRGGTALNEQYSAERVEMLCEVYLSICFRYDKVPSIYGFSVLSGIGRELLFKWVSDAEKVSRTCREYPPKRAILNLKAARATSLQNVAISGGSRTVGAVACLNNEFWNNQPIEEEKRESVTSAADLPVFDGNGNFLESTWKPMRAEASAALPVFNSGEFEEI